MALLNDRKKFIFFHLYKCGGMSLRRLLSEILPDNYELQGGHSNPKDLLIHFQKNKTSFKWNEYYKFSVIRNPFDFMVSTYFYAKSHANHFMHQRVVNENMTMVEFIPYYLKTRLEHQNPTIRPIGSNKVTFIHEFLTDNQGRMLVDFVAKLENINNDLKIIFNKIGIPFKPIQKTNVNGHREVDYRKYYNAESKSMIEKHFAKDLQIYKYKF